MGFSLNKHIISIDEDGLGGAIGAGSERAEPDQAEIEPAFSGSRFWWAWMLVALILAAGLYLALDMWRYAQVVSEAKFSQRKGEVVNAIQHRMDAYEQALRGGIGLFAASESVSRAEWHTFVGVLDVQNKYPGIQGIGYSLWLDPGDLPTHVSNIRAEGFLDYTVRPDYKREEYTAIIYLEPFDERNRQAFGYDMWSQEVRHFAMSQARDTGETTISGRVTLVQEIDADVQAGFLMYLPHYRGLGPDMTVASRRAALVGFVYSPFRMRDLMHGVVGDLEDIRLQIYDGGTKVSENLMFDSAPGVEADSAARRPRFEATEVLSIRGASWGLEFSSRPAFRKGDAAENQPMIVLLAVLACCILFGSVVWSWGVARARARAMVEKMLMSINRKRADLLLSNQELEQFAYVASHDLRAPLRNINFIITWIIEDHRGELSDAATERLGDLRKCAERMDALLNSILEYPRLGSRDKQHQLIETNKLVADAIALISPPGGITVTVQDNLPNFRGAPARMSQVFANLIGNAIKHHDLLYGEIVISGTKRGAECEFRIRDDGPGIAPKFHDRVFEMFKTLRPRDEVEGSGMGLSIVQKTIVQHGGRIWIEDNGDARGVCFVFSISLGSKNA